MSDITRQDRGEVVAPRFDNAAPAIVGITPYAAVDARIGAACEELRRQEAALALPATETADAVKATLAR